MTFVLANANDYFESVLDEHRVLKIHFAIWKIIGNSMVADFLI